MNFTLMEEQLAGSPKQVIALSGAAGDEIFQAVRAIREKDLADFILTGNEEVCISMCRRYEVKPLDILPAKTEPEEAALAVGAASSGAAQLIMKGQTSTPVLLKALLREKSLFDNDALLSHLAVLQNPEGRILGITDGGMVPSPDLEQKVGILKNAVRFFHKLGYASPRVAVLAANEKVSEKIPGSTDALALKEMNGNGVITGCLVDGPISLDLALVPEAARIKQYSGAVRGNADILLVHDVSAGNYLGKALILFGGFTGGGLVTGARVPVILLSRGDSAREKYQSMILGLLGCSREGDNA